MDSAASTAERVRHKSVPIFRSLVPYRRPWLTGDLVAGLTVWAVLVPESLAYASIAGVSPVVRLYAPPPPLPPSPAPPRSPPLTPPPVCAVRASPPLPASPPSLAALAPPGTDKSPQLTPPLALPAGIAAAVAGLLRLGFLANYISEPVMKGFIVGLALTIIVGQLPKLFGVPKGSGNFFQKLWDLITQLGNTSGLTLLVGLVSLALVLGLRRV